MDKVANDNGIKQGYIASVMIDEKEKSVEMIGKKASSTVCELHPMICDQRCEVGGIKECKIDVTTHVACVNVVE